MRDYDCSWGMPGVGRFRVNILRQRSSFMIVMRVIPFDVPTFESLNLPPVMAQVASVEKGLVLVTGVSGAGKSSTVAAILNHINQNQHRHIITIEEPIEFLHRDINCSVTQREVGVDTPDMRGGLTAAMRQDPDVIFIGDMRDPETIDTAIKAAETGHLVISTLATPDVRTTVHRVIGTFPVEGQAIARQRFAEATQAIVTQRLLTRADGQGRVAALEVLIVAGEVRDILRDSERLDELYEYMQEGREQYGMQTFDQHLADLVFESVITHKTGAAAATDEDDFESQMKELRKQARGGKARKGASAADEDDD
jgi:twitching motility protein PilT